MLANGYDQERMDCTPHTEKTHEKKQSQSMPVRQKSHPSTARPADSLPAQ